jgi:hypothetical protein
MACPADLRAKARELRLTKHLSLDEIAEHLSLPKTTVYYWIKDLPLGRERRESPHNGTRAMQAKYRRLRTAAYEQGRVEYDELLGLSTFPRLRCALHRGEVQAQPEHGVCVQRRPESRRAGRRLATTSVGARPHSQCPVPRRPGHEGAWRILGCNGRRRSRRRSIPSEDEQQ